MQATITDIQRGRELPCKVVDTEVRAVRAELLRRHGQFNGLLQDIARRPRGRLGRRAPMTKGKEADFLHAAKLLEPTTRTQREAISVGPPRIKPKAGDCCVFCSYGTSKRPPSEEGGSCCNTNGKSSRLLGTQ